jgi:hypothetical protein
VFSLNSCERQLAIKDNEILVMTIGSGQLLKVSAGGMSHLVVYKTTPHVHRKAIPKVACNAVARILGDRIRICMLGQLVATFCANWPSSAK